MTDYFVRKTGSDAAAGTSAATAWLTIGKALGAAGIASGDSVWIGAGVYRETVSVAMTSPVAETKVIGDVDGARTGDPGEVIWTAYTTNDKTAPAAAATLNLNGRDFLTFERLTIIGGNVAAGSCVLATTTNSVNITFTECTMIPGVSNSTTNISYTGLADVAANWVIDRCSILAILSSGAGVITVTLPTSAIADYDSNFVIRNCLFTGGTRGVMVTASGAASFKGGGVDIWNCTFWHPGIALNTNSANLSTSIPCTVYNSVVLSTSGLVANTSGQIIEDYNLIYAQTTRTNVTAGSNSQASTGAMQYALLVQIGQEMIIGSKLRPFLSPMPGSPLLGYGNQAAGPAVDFWNRIRPAGGAHGSYGIGYLERHDSWVKETTTTDAGSVGLSITGPGDHDFDIPVDASSTTISIKMRRDTTYGEGTGLPQAILLANGEIGFTGETKTMTAADDTWETLTFTAFTPTQKGIVTLRIVSRDTTATGKSFADTLSIA